MHVAVKIAISVGFLAILVIHIIWPKVGVDAIALALALAAAIPWLAPLLSSVELPGGFKIQFQRLKDLEQRAERAGLLASAPAQVEEPAYVSVAQDDPNLALAGLRIEVEKRLNRIAAVVDPTTKTRGVGPVLRQLHQRGVLTLPQQSALRELVGVLNNAVHGADVDRRAAEWAMDVGPRLVAALDEKLQALV